MLLFWFHKNLTHYFKQISLKNPNGNYSYSVDGTHNREASRCTCKKGSLTAETAAVLPLFACFLVFVLFFFRMLQVQICVEQALQYAGRTAAAQCGAKLFSGEENRTSAAHTQTDTDETADTKETLVLMAELKGLVMRELKKQGCPVHYITGGLAGVSLAQSDVSGNYIELKAYYRMRLPVGLPVTIRYQILQEAKCRKWTGYQPGQDGGQEDEWLYYTAYGTVYHASRECAYLDLSIRAIPAAQLAGNRNNSGRIYRRCGTCEKAASGGMVYVTDYGECYHTSLTCSGLKRQIYMIRRTKAHGKAMCRKCGGS